MRYEERKIIPLSSEAFISANCKCCLKTIKYISVRGIIVALFLKLGSADIHRDLRECSFQEKVDKARKNSYKAVFKVSFVLGKTLANTAVLTSA